MGNSLGLNPGSITVPLCSLTSDIREGEGPGQPQRYSELSEAVWSWAVAEGS